MVLGRAPELVRGGLAWVAGYALTLALVFAGFVDSQGGALEAAADVYASAHFLPSLDPGGAPPYLVAVPLLVIGLAGYRAGRSLTTGIAGRLRAGVQSVLGTRRYRLPQAAAAAALLAGGYTIAAAIGAFLLGAALSAAVVGALLTSLVIGVPAAVIGAIR